MSSTTSVLVHNLAPPKPEFPSGWDFIQSLRKNSRDFIQSTTDDSEQVYVHPLVKVSASSLSLKSLEMCTESLGSETGSNINSDIDGFSSIPFDKRSYDDKTPLKTEEFPKKVKQNTSFPPPLTSMSRSDHVQVKTHREEGRLVIKVISSSSCPPFFRAERLNGRLRLSLLDNGCWEGEDERDENEEKIIEDENVGEPDKNFKEDGHEDGFKRCFWSKNLEENSGKIVCAMGDGEWSCCRCIGDRNGSKRLHSLPIFMAIS